MANYASRESEITAVDTETQLDEDFGTTPGEIDASGLSMIHEMLVGIVWLADAEDDAGVAKVYFRGNGITGEPSVVIGGGGIGASGTGVESTQGNALIRIPLDIPIVGGKNFSVYARIAGTANLDAHIAVSLVMT